MQNLTIYQNGYTLVNRIEQFKLRKGPNTLKISDIPLGTVPSSVLVLAETDAAKLKTINVSKAGESIMSIFAKHYQGAPVTLVSKGKKAKGSFMGFIGDKKIVLGQGNTISFVPLEGLKIQTENDIEYSNHIEIALDSSKAKKEVFEMHYLAENFLSWEPAYQVIVEGNKALFLGEAVIRNDSGVAVKGAEVSCVAGEVEKAEKGYGGEMFRLAAFEDSGRAAKANAYSRDEAPKPENIMETYRYDLPNKLTIGPNGTVKVFLMTNKLDAETSYFYEGSAYGGEGGVSSRVKFTNNTKNIIHEGVVNVYLKGKDGKKKFLGEKNIPAMPEGEAAQIELGTAFDVVVTKHVQKKGLIGQHKATVIVVENKKNEPITMTVKQHMHTKSSKFGPTPTDKKEGYVLWENVEIPAKGKMEFWYA